VSLRVERGEVVTLIGANGAGKSTTLRTISGLLRPSAGAIRYGGEPIASLSAEQIVWRGISHSPEGRRIFANLTVQENLDLGAYIRRDRQGIRDDLERVFTLFPRLRERRRQAGGTLSGGEQQMLAMGRALMSRPTLLLLDEPSLGLAPLLVEADLPVRPRDQRAGDDDPARRAEREPGAQGRPPRLRARDRQRDARGRGGRARQGRAREEGVFGGLT